MTSGLGTALTGTGPSAPAGSDGGATGSGDGGADTGSPSSQPPVESAEGALDTAVTEVQDLLTGIVATLPRIVVGLVVFAVFWGGARLVRRAVRPRMESWQGQSIGNVLTSVIGGFITGIGVFGFLAVVAPSINLGTLLGAGGVVALAAGFAFQDLLENMMSGLLLLIRRPFEEGDVVSVDEVVVEGVVEAITIRETRIRRFDRQVVLVPNAQVYKNAILIQTGEPTIRSSVIVGVDYDADLQHAEDVAVAALRHTDGVLDEPAPEAFYTELAGSSVSLDLRYWHGSGQHELRRVQGEVVKAVHRAFGEAGIDIPWPITTLDAKDEVLRALAGSDGDGLGASPEDRSRTNQSQ